MGRRPARSRWRASPADIVKREDGSTLLEIPLSAGLAVTVFTAAVAPVLVAIGAVDALVSKVTLVVERDEDHAAV